MNETMVSRTKSVLIIPPVAVLGVTSPESLYDSSSSLATPGVSATISLRWLNSSLEDASDTAAVIAQTKRAALRERRVIFGLMKFTKII